LECILKRSASVLSREYSETPLLEGGAFEARLPDADHGSVWSDHVADTRDESPVEDAITEYLRVAQDSQTIPDHFEFIAAQREDSQTAPAKQDASAQNSPFWSAANSSSGDGRPDPGGGPGDPTLEDTDPDPAPPPVGGEDPPEEPYDAGRDPGATPGNPASDPAGPPPDTSSNAANGRDPDAIPDPPPGGGPLNSYTSGGAAATSYNITVEFVGTWSSQLQDAFVAATDYLSSVILADLPDDVVDGVLVDDLNITATLTSIDGVGGTLGSAGPRAIRDVSYLPSTGAMTFDIADADNMYDLGRWQSIVLHEIMHTLGFGTLWSLMGLTIGSVAGGDIRFTGANAVSLYNSEFPGIAGSDPDSLIGVPVETDGGPGTAGGHWDEVLFDQEFMTGYNDASNYVSQMTIAALEDMGYDTVLDDPNTPADLFGVFPADPLLDIIA
jgi:hypothetical protein